MSEIKQNTDQKIILDSFPVSDRVDSINTCNDADSDLRSFIYGFQDYVFARLSNAERLINDSVTNAMCTDEILNKWSNPTENNPWIALHGYLNLLEQRVSENANSLTHLSGRFEGFYDVLNKLIEVQVQLDKLSNKITAVENLETLETRIRSLENRFLVFTSPSLFIKAVARRIRFRVLNLITKVFK